jgi:shikimate kinase
MNIALTGFMGTGKTEVGKLLAQLLKWQFIDVDAEIEKQVGIKISDIFAHKGEPYFRTAETDAIKLVSLLDKAVIACGGGAVLKTENVQALEKTGKIVCLRARPETIYERIKNDTSRPLLQVPNPKKKIEEMLSERAPHYARSSFAIDTDGKTIETIVEEIISLLKIN